VNDAPVPVSAAPEKGVADILKEAYELYRRHARALIVTCAVLFVPASLVKSCAVSVILGPTVAAATVAASAAEVQMRDLANTQRALQEGFANHADKKTIEKLQADQKKALAELQLRTAQAVSARMGDFTLMMLGILGTLVTAFFVYGVVVPLTNGALTITVADRILGGNAGWREVWMLLFRRLGPLLSAVIPAALLVALGFAMFIIPGVILGLLFAFAAPVVLIEGLRGRAALQRSTALVSADWLRVALMIVVFVVLQWLTQLVVGIIVPDGALFLRSLLSDLVTMLFLPVPILGMVLLYFDIRRRTDGFTDDRLRADLENLKTT
jgi:hypothetical protein